MDAGQLLASTIDGLIIGLVYGVAAMAGEDAVRETKRHLGWPEDKQFYIPEEALKHFREAVDRGAAQEAEWKTLVEEA